MFVHDIHYSNQANNIFLLLVQTNDVVHRTLEEGLNEENITLPQLRLLLILSRHDRPLTSAELCRYLFRKSQTITGTLNHLEKSGYVEMVGDLKDKRLMRVHITEKGEELLQKHTRWVSTAVEEMLSCFTKDELQQLEGYLKRLRQWLFRLYGIDLIEPVSGFDGTDNI